MLTLYNFIKSDIYKRVSDGVCEQTRANESKIH